MFFFGHFADGSSTPTFGQSRASTHSPQAGRRARQTARPCSMSQWLHAMRCRLGTTASSSRSACTLVFAAVSLTAVFAGEESGIGTAMLLRIAIGVAAAGILLALVMVLLGRGE